METVLSVFGFWVACWTGIQHTCVLPIKIHGCLSMRNSKYLYQREERTLLLPYLSCHYCNGRWHLLDLILDKRRKWDFPVSRSLSFAICFALTGVCMTSWSSAWTCVSEHASEILKLCKAEMEHCKQDSWTDSWKPVLFILQRPMNYCFLLTMNAAAMWRTVYTWHRTVPKENGHSCSVHSIWNRLCVQLLRMATLILGTVTLSIAAAAFSLTSHMSSEALGKCNSMQLFVAL